MPSSREMSSLLNVSPGMSPRFFSQYMEQNEPEKKIPSTAAKAITRCANLLSEPIQLRHQSAFFLTHGSVSIALLRPNQHHVRIARHSSTDKKATYKRFERAAASLT